MEGMSSLGGTTTASMVREINEGLRLEEQSSNSPDCSFSSTKTFFPFLVKTTRDSAEWFWGGRNWFGTNEKGVSDLIAGWVKGNTVLHIEGGLMKDEKRPRQ